MVLWGTNRVHDILTHILCDTEWKSLLQPTKSDLENISQGQYKIGNLSVTPTSQFNYYLKNVYMHTWQKKARQYFIEAVSPTIYYGFDPKKPISATYVGYNYCISNQ